MNPKFFMITLAALSLTGTSMAADAQPELESTKSKGTLHDAFTKDFKVKGTIGIYAEETMADASDKDFGWATNYIKLKYETGKWNNLKLGIEFLAHNQLWNHHDDNASDGFDKDIEDKSGVAQMYLDWSITDKTNFRIGRWEHKNISHIDDLQSEGFYIQSKEIENLTLVAGMMRKFAEIDYDDFEGWDKDSQDLSDEGTYGDSKDYLAFIEATYKAGDLLKINPYYMVQPDYAAVIGGDLNLTAKVGDDLKLGADFKAYNVSPEGDQEDIYDDATVWGIEPFVKVAGFTLAVGYTEADEGSNGKDAMNKPAWMRDYMTGFDQDKVYGSVKENARGQYAKLKYKQGKFGAHVYYGEFEYGEDRDAQIDELELQVNYKFTDNFDGNIRYFIVDYNDAAGDTKDYDKIEARFRYKF